VLPYRVDYANYVFNKLKPAVRDLFGVLSKMPERNTLRDAGLVIL
jgi:hypothetical protein